MQLYYIHIYIYIYICSLPPAFQALDKHALRITELKRLIKFSSPRIDIRSAFAPFKLPSNVVTVFKSVSHSSNISSHTHLFADGSNVRSSLPEGAVGQSRAITRHHCNIYIYIYIL